MSVLRNIGYGMLSLTALAAIAGCQHKTETEATANPTALSVPKKASTPLPPQPSFMNTPAGAAADVEFNCDLEPGAKEVKVKVKNSAAETRDYSIYIIWLKADSGTPIGSGLAVVEEVNPGETKEVVLTAEVVEKADRCTKNVYAGKLA
ncbi:MAG: hypothetical protein ACRDAX_08280 [Propionibacteriaceae bacterium]